MGVSPSGVFLTGTSLTGISITGVSLQVFPYRYFPTVISPMGVFLIAISLTGISRTGIFLTSVPLQTILSGLIELIKLFDGHLWMANPLEDDFDQVIMAGVYGFWFDMTGDMLIVTLQAS